MRRRITGRIISVLLLISLCASYSSCRKKNQVFTHDRLCNVAFSFKAEKAYSLDQLNMAIYSLKMSNIRSCYFTSNNANESQGLYDEYLNQFGSYPYLQTEQGTYFYVLDGNANLHKRSFEAYMFTLKKEEDANRLYTELYKNRGEYDEASSGENDGYVYKICYGKSGDSQNAFGVYMKGKSVIYVLASTSVSTEYRQYDTFFKDLGLVSPYAYFGS